MADALDSATASNVQFKSCSKCGQSKELNEFHKNKKSKDGRLGMCKVCSCERSRQYRINNPESVNAALTKWRSENKERIAEYNSQYAQQHRERLRVPKREWARRNAEIRNRQRRDRRKTNPDQFRKYDEKKRSTPEGKINSAVHSNLGYTLRMRGIDKRRRKWTDLLGFTSAELVAHLERQFTKGMTWDNYGKWHIDHVIPSSSFSFDSTDHPEFKACWALTNLRPMWAAENIAKHAKILYLV